MEVGDSFFLAHVQLHGGIMPHGLTKHGFTVIGLVAKWKSLVFLVKDRR